VKVLRYLPAIYLRIFKQYKLDKKDLIQQPVLAFCGVARVKLMVEESMVRGTQTGIGKADRIVMLLLAIAVQEASSAVAE
jgi:hypothetical protein